MHQTTERFWRCYHSLPPRIQKLADKNFEVLRNDPQHPSLQLKKVGKFWSARIGLDFRALAITQAHGYTWVWIGSHSEYDRLLK